MAMRKKRRRRQELETPLLLHQPQIYRSTQSNSQKDEGNFFEKKRRISDVQYRVSGSFLSVWTISCGSSFCSTCHTALYWEKDGQPVCCELLFNWEVLVLDGNPGSGSTCLSVSQCIRWFVAIFLLCYSTHTEVQTHIRRDLLYFFFPKRRQSSLSVRGLLASRVIQKNGQISEKKNCISSLLLALLFRSSTWRLASTSPPDRFSSESISVVNQVV